MYNLIFLLYILAGEKTLTVGECSSGDIAIFLILSRKKMKIGAIASAGFYIVPYYVRGRVITIFVELERCYFSPQVCIPENTRTENSTCTYQFFVYG